MVVVDGRGLTSFVLMKPQSYLRQTLETWLSGVPAPSAAIVLALASILTPPPVEKLLPPSPFSPSSYSQFLPILSGYSFDPLPAAD